jgi:hypothetical protein
MTFTGRSYPRVRPPQALLYDRRISLGGGMADALA